MKFSGKTYLKKILKITKKVEFQLSLEDTFFEEPQGEGGIKWKLLSRFRVKKMKGLKRLQLKAEKYL